MSSSSPEYAQNDSEPIQGYSPAGQLLHLISGYWVAQAIHVAAELGIADLLGKKACSIVTLAQQTGVHAPSLYRVLRALASVGIFSEIEPQSFVQTPMGLLLRRDMPGNLAAFSRFQGDAWHWNAWGAIVDSVKTGRCGMALRHDAPHCFEYLARHPESASTFNQAMSGYAAQVNAAVVEAYDFTAAKLIVDVGGGQGQLLGVILDNAIQARGVLFDLADVASHADAVLAAHGVAERCRIVAGDFFSVVPDGGDVYLLSSILHDWDDDQAVKLLRNVGVAMRNLGTGARLLIVEHVLPGGNEPHPGKFIDLEMMLITGGKERTLPEYRSLLSRAGFEYLRLLPTAMSASIVEARCAR